MQDLFDAPALSAEVATRRAPPRNAFCIQDQLGRASAYRFKPPADSQHADHRISGFVTAEIISQDESLRHQCEIRYLLTLSREAVLGHMKIAKLKRSESGYSKLRSGFIAARRAARMTSV